MRMMAHAVRDHAGTKTPGHTAAGLKNEAECAFGPTMQGRMNNFSRARSDATSTSCEAGTLTALLKNGQNNRYESPPAVNDKPACVRGCRRIA
jgi:hypothetical protein